MGTSGLAASGGGTAASATATIQTTTAHGFVTGQLVTTTGIGVAGHNGTFPITGVPDSTHFTFTATTGGLAASGAGRKSSPLGTRSTGSTTTPCGLPWTPRNGASWSAHRWAVRLRRTKS